MTAVSILSRNRPTTGKKNSDRKNLLKISGFSENVGVENEYKQNTNNKSLFNGKKY